MKTKKILAAIAALTLVLGAVPTQPFADYVGNTAIMASAEDSNIVKSGSCGTNATYTLDSDGLLTISGTGAIAESAFYIYANTLAKDIKKVVINNGITELGSNSFCEAGLAEIELPNSVTIIGENAFRGCSNLTSISIPNSVENIGSAAFYSCTSLSSLTFEDNSKLESIGDSAFNSCSSLKSVVIPDSVTSIGSWTFDTSYLKSITAPCKLNGNPTIENAIGSGIKVTWNHTFEEGSDTCVNGDAILCDGAVVDIGSCGENATYEFDKSTGTLTISGTGSIRENAFHINFTPWANDIKKVVINNGIAKIGNSAFYGCTNLKSITATCKLNGDLVIADAMNNGVTVTWNHVFEEGSDMCINGDADIEGNFYGSCGAYHEETEVYDEVSYKFEPETGILTISGTGAIRFDSFADWNVSFADEIIKVEIGNEITEIDDSAFYGCTSLETVEMNSVEKIGWGAFCECTSLESITIPDSVTFMDKSVFKECSNLTSITAPCTLKENESIANAAENGATVTWSHVFAEGSDTCECGDVVKGACGDSATYVLDSTTGKLTISGTGTVEGFINIAIANDVKSIVIGSDITKIGDDNFYGYSSLENVTFAENSKLESIGYKCFYGCSSLTNITIPDSVTSIGSFLGGTFVGCPNLKNITAPCTLINNKSLKNSGATVEYNHVGDKVTVKGKAATCEEDGLTDKVYCSVCDEVIVKQEVIPMIDHTPVSKENGVEATCEKDGSEADIVCKDCGTVISYGDVIPATGHNYVDGICTDCGKHEIITGKCGDSANYSFDKATGILTIEGYDIIGENVSDTWGDWADEVKEIVIDERITVIGENAFSKCSSLTSATLGSNVPDGFTYIPKTAKIYIPAEAYEEYAVLEESGYKFYDAETDKALSAMKFGDYVKGVGFTLDGKIGVNLQTTEDAENFTVTCDGKTIPVVASANGVSFYIAPKEMVKEYTITVNGTTKTITPVDVVALYTADDAKPEIAKYADLAQALSDYCKAANAYFDGDEATKVVMPEGFKPVSEEALEMMKSFMGDKSPDDGNTYKTSLVLNSETALKIYVSKPDGITVDDVTADAGEKIQVNKNTVCVKISNIGPVEANNSVYTVNGGAFSVPGYCVKAISQTDDEDLANLCYLYTEYANQAVTILEEE